MKLFPIRQLYYITHINNISSILKHGILSHELVESRCIDHVPIYDAAIIQARRNRETPDGKTLWNFANLYFNARNPMLYRVLFGMSVGRNDIAILALQPSILNRPDMFISTGNAASPLSDILPASEFWKAWREIKDFIKMDWWTEENGSKRKIMAECLVPDVVSPDNIRSIYVATHEIADRLKTMLRDSSINVIPVGEMFFQPEQKSILTENLHIVEGDMFFSRMQTLTVSVNCVGVMGKGLASRAKYQFPDVYVVYQDLCRNGTLKMGKPYLYKRETSFDYQLADEPEKLVNSNSETWFLLFPTKRHWRQRADIEGIEEGMNWLSNNYIKEGIQSLALPALGCGLGKLNWREVGPLLCKYLVNFEIPVRVYLPTDKKISSEELSKDFLLEHK